jgi:hypothetical protein
MQNRIQVALAFVVMLSLPASSALADSGSYMSGNDLYGVCVDNDGAQQAKCIGYLAGIADAMDLVAPAAFGGWRACLPSGSTDRQLSEIATKWLAAHAEKRQIGAAGLVAEAFQAAFPCKT